MFYIKEKMKPSVLFNNMQQAIKNTIIAVSVGIAFLTVISAPLVSATSISRDVTLLAQAAPVIDEPKAIKNDCNGPDIQAGATGDNHCGILDYLVLFIQILSGAVGLVVVAVIIFSGIQYSASGDDPAQLSAAKKRIANAILAMIMYAFMFAFLQYLIPGGVL